MQLNSMFRDWLHRFSITDSVIDQFKIHEDNDRIAIPIHDESGAFLYNKYRRSPLRNDGPKYMYDPGGKLALFGRHNAVKSPSVLWTEGEKDSLVAWSHAIPAVTGTGGALSIDLSWSSFFADKEVIICFDNDPAGGEGMVRALSVAPHARLVFIPDRGGVKDISDYAENGGNLHDLLTTARSFDSLEAVKEDRISRIARWQSTYFHDAYLKHSDKPLRQAKSQSSRQSSRQGDHFLRAKSHPITSLVLFTRGKARCIWHADQTPSLTYYEATNSCYCFGCGRYGDVIDVYRTINRCSFSEAVRALQ